MTDTPRVHNKHAGTAPPDALYTELMALGFTKFAARVANGEFDATEAESEEWARSQTDPQIIAMMEAMGIAPDRRKDQ